MIRSRSISRLLATCVLTVTSAAPAHADELRNVKRGEPLPAYRLPTVDGRLVESEALKGLVVVMVCLSAEQRSSELAAMESSDVIKAIGDEGVRLIHVTADVVHKPYFERFREERRLDVPLALDADRALYGRLGLIVFPTTIIADREGKLARVVALREADYAQTLDAYVRHALGTIDDKELEERLKAHPSADASPKSRASAHRAAARFLREKGLLAGAKDELNKAREQDPGNADILLDLADLELAGGNLDAADELVRGVLDAEPEHRRAKQIKGIVLYRRDRLTEAESVLNEALVLNPDPARIHYYLGRICERQGQPGRAIEHYREALRRFLNEPEVSTPPSSAPR